MTLRVDAKEINHLISKAQRAIDDHRLTSEQRVRAELRLRQLKAIQRYAQKLKANQA